MVQVKACMSDWKVKMSAGMLLGRKMISESRRTQKQMNRPAPQPSKEMFYSLDCAISGATEQGTQCNHQMSEF